MNKQNLNIDQKKSIEGILLVNKPKGQTSFALVGILRKRLGVKKIGHAGTLDPFATGVMVMLIGRSFTRLSDQFLLKDKEYQAELRLGITTDTYDCEGKILSESSYVPTLEEIQHALKDFQGEISQVPPMFSAKKIGGKKLYDLARKGQEVERAPVKITLETKFIRYEYPYLEIKVSCSKGTYIRSLAYDLGLKLGCGAHLSNLKRTRSGSFCVEDCVDGSLLKDPTVDLEARFIQLNNGKGT